MFLGALGLISNFDILALALDPCIVELLGDCHQPPNMDYLTLLNWGDYGSRVGATRNCSGNARFVGPGAAGNGKYGNTTIGSLAVIPSQFFGSNSTSLADYTKYGGMLRPYVTQISVTVVNPAGPNSDLTFGPVTDAIGSRSDAAKLIAQSGGNTLILETNGFLFKDQAQFVTVTIPSALNCPVGTKAIK
jgi:hypothetical protein